MIKRKLFPDYVFESSWEVCNKVGGIYTVLSTRAKTLQERLGDKIIFIGPSFKNNNSGSDFVEDTALFSNWRLKARKEGLNVRIGRWTIPGRPMAILVDFLPFFEHKNEIYGWLWEHYRVDSLHAYGDYDDASMFSLAAAKVVESFYDFYLDGNSQVIYHANEWMTGLGLMYIKHHKPQIGTVFTTHATTIGRSIAGNNKPLYDYLHAYNGDQMAEELNVQSKHSVEKQAAHHADCFTTVSQITDRECIQLLEKPADVVLPNGFEDSFIPKNKALNMLRKAARRRLFDIANALIGSELNDDTLIISISGRYEFRNKGIDVFIEAMNMLNHDSRLKKNVLALIEVPGWVKEPRKDLQERLNSISNGGRWEANLDRPEITHWLNNAADDSVLRMTDYLGFHNNAGNKVNIVFLPCYLDGSDGIANIPYYNMMPANDLCIYPSYYEPWGYTPLESVAFGVPCITTDLSGFGLWANTVLGRYGEITDGIKVVNRTDHNYMEVAEAIKDTIIAFSNMTKAEVNAARMNAVHLSNKALWHNFIASYYEAYGIALRKANERKNQ